MKLIVSDKLDSGVTLTFKIGQGHSSSTLICTFLRSICKPNMKTLPETIRKI